jgi:hypothetical protein
MKTLYRLILALATCTAVTTAMADEMHSLPVKPSQEWKDECGSCHLAFPPSLLPAESWRNIMGGLDKHFGTDASLNPQETKLITNFLVKHADSRRHSAKAPSRITETPHFRHEHREIGAGIWKRAAIQSLSNCAACHPNADKGNFDEHSVRIPR